MLRLEYTLKTSQFVRATNSGLEVLWDSYIKERLPGNFFESVHKLGLAPTLIESPPSKQTLNEQNELDFKPSISPTTNAELFIAIRRLRNNLFHGGKSGDPDHARNDELIEQALALIDFMLKTDDDLRQIFEGRY
jgi:hypothetical protein